MSDTNKQRPPQQSLCTFDELEENACRSFKFAAGRSMREGFLVKRAGRVFAYANSCPHTGATMNWQENRFLDVTECYILCAVHGALFEIHTGRCIFGPCQGDCLEKIPLLLRDGKAYLAR